MLSLPLGPVLCDLRSTELCADEREMLLHPLVGGVIFFSRNYQSPEQIASLSREIHGLRYPPLLLGVDHEGGSVQRFQKGFSHLPSLSTLGMLSDSDPVRAQEYAKMMGWLMAAELLVVGLDISFAPVLDVGCHHSVIGARAFSENPDTVTKLARAYVAGMSQAGMAAVGKHFPGHGQVMADSHLQAVYDQRQFSALESHDLKPFCRLIADQIPAIMPGHVIYPQIDSHPASCSEVWLRDILRDRFNFQGVIVSDDLSMVAVAEIAEDYPKRAELAVNAGCDLIMACNQKTAMPDILDHANIQIDQVAQRRLINLKANAAYTSISALRADSYWKKCHAVATDLIARHA